MLRKYKGGLKLANNLLQMFRSNTLGRIVKDNINLTIKSTITHKVVISGVEKRKAGELELGTEVGVEAKSGRVIWVDIGISAEEMGGIRIFRTDFLNMVT